jgi:hypothetical protein
LVPRGTTKYFARAVSLLLCLAMPALAPAQRARAEADRPPFRFQLIEFSMRLERAFHGVECPEYAIEVKGDGTGRCSCNPSKGVAGRFAAFAVSRAALRDLLSTLYRGDFFDLKSEYQGRAEVSVDSAGTVTVGGVLVMPNPGHRSVFTVRIGDYSKRVTVKTGDHPEVLERLTQQMDDMAASACGALAGTDGD